MNHLIFFLLLDENLCCGYSLEAPQRGASNEYPQHMFSASNKKNYPSRKHFVSLKPNFYIVKLGFTGVYIIFLISAQNIDCGYLYEPPHRGSSNKYPQSMF